MDSLLQQVAERHPLLHNRPLDGFVPDGWGELLELLLSDLDRLALRGERIEIRQIQPRFGRMRVWWEATNPDAVRTLIAAAESASSLVCEVCSEPGRHFQVGPGHTLCPRHQCLIPRRQSPAQAPRGPIDAHGASILAEQPRLFRSNVPRTFQVPEGWVPIVKRAIRHASELLSEEQLPQFRFDQIAVKGGCELAVAWSVSSGPAGQGLPLQDLTQIIEAAMAAAADACQSCSARDTLRIAMPGVGLKRLCRRHAPFGAEVVHG